MTRDEKKTNIENMAESVMSVKNPAEQSMMFMAMSAYAEGKAAGNAITYLIDRHFLEKKLEEQMIANYGKARKEVGC